MFLISQPLKKENETKIIMQNTFVIVREKHKEGMKLAWQGRIDILESEF